MNDSLHLRITVLVALSDVLYLGASEISPICCIGKGRPKAFLYSIPSVSPGVDPCVQAVSPQVTWSESHHWPGITFRQACSYFRSFSPAGATTVAHVRFQFTTHLSTAKGWKAEMAWSADRSGHPSAAGRAQNRGKFAGQRPTFYHRATQPTINCILGSKCCPVYRDVVGVCAATTSKTGKHSDGKPKRSCNAFCFFVRQRAGSIKSFGPVRKSKRLDLTAVWLDSPCATWHCDNGSTPSEAKLLSGSVQRLALRLDRCFILHDFS